MSQRPDANLDTFVENHDVSHHVLTGYFSFLHKAKRVAHDHIMPSDSHKLSLYRRTCIEFANEALALRLSRNDLPADISTDYIWLVASCDLARQVKQGYDHLSHENISAHVQDLRDFREDLVTAVDLALGFYDKIHTRLKAMSDLRSKDT